MLTPTSSYASASSRAGSLQSMLQELDRKISQISELKGQITERMHYQQIEQSARKQQFTKDRQREQQVFRKIDDLTQFFKNEHAYFIRKDLQQYSKHSIQCTMSIVNFYEKEIKKCKNYYESQIWDLREEIKRQYKVIAMMKQEVQDLMVLMKYKQSDEQDEDRQDDLHQQNSKQDNQYQNSSQNSSKQIKENSRQNQLKLSLLNNRMLSSQLDVIQQQTERTLQSSQRSQNAQNQALQSRMNFIKIQQKQEDEANRKQDQQINLQNQKQQINAQPRLQNIILKQEQMQKDQINAYQDYCEDLTPKESSRKDYSLHMAFEKQNEIKIQRSYNKSCQVVQNQQQVYYHIKTQIEQANRSSARNKIHTAPSDDRKSDHLQSIFFLDEQPEYLNKTTKLQCYDKLKYVDSHAEQKISHVLHQNLISYSGEDDYSLNQEGRQTTTNISKKKLAVPLLATQKLAQYSSERLDQHRQQYEFYQRKNQQAQQQYAKSVNQHIQQQRKKGKNNKHLTQEETNQYIFKKFNKAIPLTEFKNSSSMPVDLNSEPLGELSPNLECERMSSRNSIQSKPKTKQFLQQFRRTFNKCLNSMQVSKKNSTKLNSSSSSSSSKYNAKNSNGNSQSDGGNNLIAGVMTFGKGYSGSSSHSSLSHKDSEGLIYKQNRGLDLDGKQIKAVDHMLRELENNNKFIIGGKKLQLKYEGDKKNGARNGSGMLYYSNGLCYEGEFKEGLRNGYGILKFNHIQIYNGDWINDQIEGQGKIRNCAIINKRKSIYSNQSPLGKWISYSGEFRNSKFEGSGTLYLQGGQKFVGNFSNGYANGEGSIYRKNGEVEHGIWHNNILVERQTQKQRV